jgi:hypothetical protein
MIVFKYIYNDEKEKFIDFAGLIPNSKLTLILGCLRYTSVNEKLICHKNSWS